MRFVCAEKIRQLDQLAIQQAGIPGITLMERAGAGAARAARQLARGLPVPHRFTVLAGSGNNGGDGFVAARRLHECGEAVEVWLTRSAEALRGDARIAFGHLVASGVRPRILADPADWRGAAMRHPPGGVLIDALLGTGATGAPRGAVAAAIEWARVASARCRVLALDLPSGIDADRGDIPGAVAPADLTVTFGYPKPAMRRLDRLPVFGRIEVLDIGLPPLTSGWDGKDALIGAPDWHDLPPRRPRDAHKGDFGHLLVVGGSPGFAGAPLLSARAALRCGAGRVSLATPDPGLSISALAQTPELMVQPLADSPETAELPAFDVGVVGPGMGVSESAHAWMLRLVNAERPLVLDADALNLWRGNAGGLRAFGERLVLTPHPAEAARLLACETADVQRDRHAALQALASLTGAVVVLKGAGTLVGAPQTPPRLNPTGNPGMATAGSGDVLSGMIGALMGQGLPPLDAACLGVYLHGTAGDLAAREQSEAGLCASDLIARLGEAWLTLQPR